MMGIDVGLIAFVVLCAAGIVASLVVPRATVPAVVAWVGGVAAAALLWVGAAGLFHGSATAAVTLWSVPPLGSVIVHVDTLAGLFLLVTGAVCLPASVFAASALAPLRQRYNLRGYAALYFALLVSIAWILVSADVFSFLLAWEIMSILSYLLVAFQHEEGSAPMAAYGMLALSEAGALAAAVGLLTLAGHAGSLEFSQLKALGPSVSPDMRLAVFLLTFLGFGVKAGLVPVNMWLPRAYTAAPSAFVPVLAGATLNLGLYAIFRVNADLLPTSAFAPGIIALLIGTLSALVGILYATTDTDLKTLFANSSIENAGIITVGFGAGFVFIAAGKPTLGGIAFLVGLYHLVNHSLYKTLLFVGTGAVSDRARTRDLDRLGGLIHRMPLTTLAMLIGVLSIAALPPFNGFVSEWLTLQTLLRSAELDGVGVKIVFALCGAALALTAALAVTCFAKVFAMGFLGLARSPDAERAGEGSRSALAAMGFLAVLCILLGILPTYAIEALNYAVLPVAHANAADALVPPFFAGSPGHDSLPAAFVSEFRSLGAQVGQSVVPGPGLVMLHRGETANPVVFAAAPAYLVVVLAGLIGLVFVVVRGGVARRRRADRRECWDGGVRRLLPEMTYTATGFSNPVRVIFQAIFRPTIVEDTQETVAEHFRTAIRREAETVHILDRAIVRPVIRAAFAIARFVARMHHGLLNAYIAYALLSLVVVFVAFTAS